MDVHELCISGVLEEHEVPKPPSPRNTHTRLAAQRGGVGVLRVCLCVCASVKSSLRAGVHRHPSVCLLQTPAGRHGTPCRKCVAPLPPSLKASRCMSHPNTHTHTHTHTPRLFRLVLAPDPSIKRQLAADVNNLHLYNYISHFGPD